jgi:hypothetical protein
MMHLVSPERSERAARIDRLVGAVPPDAPFGTYVFASGDPAAFLARYLEHEVFGEVFGNSKDLLAAEYDPYEAASVFVIVVDHRRRVAAGVLRIVVASPAGLKSLNDIGRLWGQDADVLVRTTGLDPSRCVIWDVATLAVGRDYRRATTRGLVSLALWQAVGVMASRAAVELLVAIIDVPVYRLLQAKLQQIFSTFDGVGPLRYLDSPASLPVWSRPEHVQARLADTDPTLHRLLVEGRGLEAAVTPPDWDEATACALSCSLPAGRDQTRSLSHPATGGMEEPSPSRRSAEASSADIALANNHPCPKVQPRSVSLRR